MSLKRKTQSGWKVKVGGAEVEKILIGNELSEDDKRTIVAWAQTVEDFGPDYLQTKPNRWADHPLYGDRIGQRASSFSYSGRIIYERKEIRKVVVVMKITPIHNYKKTEDV